MSNGGYKGSTPARETSPEQYPGVWELTEQFQAQADGNWPFQETDCAPKSLRFNSSDTATLSKSVNVEGNRRTWTFSFWVKLLGGGTYSTNHILCGGLSGNTSSTQSGFEIEFTSTGALSVNNQVNNSIAWSVETNAVFRDYASWYSVCVAHDSTQATPSDRLKIYVNGVQINSFSTSNYPSQNYQSEMNKATTDRIGSSDDKGSPYLPADFLLAEVNFIDGQALSCEEFGFFDGQGVWQPKRFTGDYSSGPVYSNSSDANGVVSSGNLSILFDGNTSTNVNLSNSNDYAIATQNQSISVTSTIGMWTVTGSSYPTMRVTDTNGTVTVLDHNDTTIVNGGWTDFSYSGTVAKIELAYIPGSGSANPFYALRVDGVTLTDASVGRNSFHLDFADSSSNAALGFDSSGLGNDWAVNSISHTSATGTDYSGNNQITGSESGFVSGYGPETLFDGDLSNQTDQTDTGSTGEDGFMYWNPDTAIPVSNKLRIHGRWYTPAMNNPYLISDQVSVNGNPYVTPGNGTTNSQWVDLSSYLSTYSITSITNITWKSVPTSSNRLDPAMAAIEVDNTVLVNAPASETDALVDSPVNGNQTDPSCLGGIIQGNYATLNPIDPTTVTLSNGNLDCVTNNAATHVRGTIGISSGKWYWEIVAGSSSELLVGICTPSLSFTSDMTGGGGYSYYSGNGNKYTTSGSSYGASWTTGDTIGVAFDADSGTLTFYKNGSSQGQAFSGLTSGPYFPAASDGSSSASSNFIINFGQRPYKYQNAGTDRPSADYKSLCTTNLPEPSIPIPSQYFDAKVYSGSGSARTFDDLSLSPDFVWIKCTSDSAGHGLYDRVRGVNKVLRSDSNAVENDSPVYGYLNQFGSNGFSLTPGTHSSHSLGDVNMTGRDYVAYSWDAGEATTTIAAGSLNSSAYDQSQTWSSLITPYLNSPLGAGDGTQIFDGSKSTQTTSNNTSGAGIKFTPTSNISGIIELWLRNGDTVNSTFSYSVDGGSNFTNVTTVSGSGSYVNIGQQTITTTNGLIVRHITTAGTNAVSWRRMRVSGTELIDSGVSVPNVPSIASTVRSSPESGFSIIKASVDSTNTLRTVGHNLGKEPEFIISKNLEWEDLWFTYHKDIQTDNKQYMNLNGYTGRTSSGSTIWGHTPHVMGFNGALWVPGGATDEIIFYCFTSVEGYSKISSYVGSGNQKFIHCGFTPAWIMIKRYTDNTVGQWSIYNTASSPHNEVKKKIWADDTASEENHPNNSIDIVSNGFVIDPGGDAPNVQYTNNGSVGYLYIAIAESPFKTARAR